MKKKELVKEIKNLIKKYPNDTELGNQVRKLYLTIKEKKQNGV
jgi:hypothetical protein